MNVRRILSSIGWDGAFWSVCGFVTFAIGILDFLPQFQLTDDPILRLVLSSIGLVLGATVAQTAGRKAEILELRETLGIAESHLLDHTTETPQQLVGQILRARRYVLDSRLNWATPRYTKSYLSGSHGEYHRFLFHRLTKGEIIFRQVEVIFHRQSLELTIYRLLLHEECKFFVRHYEPPPKAIPAIHVLSFDDETFFLGGFHATEASGVAQRLQIREPNLARLLTSYWDTLWNTAIPLNEGGIVNWGELKRIGLRVGMTENEFDTMVGEKRAEAQRDKRMLRRK